jgi:hypothetical protein
MTIDTPLPLFGNLANACFRSSGVDIDRAAVTTDEEPSRLCRKTLKPWYVVSVAVTGVMRMSAVAWYRFVWSEVKIRADATATTTRLVISHR